jgi:hypothetical protein
MNKKLISAAFFAIFIHCVNAQNIRLGIFANPGLSWLKSDVSRIAGDGSHIGINAGLTIDKQFTSH